MGCTNCEKHAHFWSTFDTFCRGAMINKGLGPFVVDVVY